MAKTLCPWEKNRKRLWKKGTYLDEPFIVNLGSDSESEISDSDGDVTEVNSATTAIPGIQPINYNNDNYLQDHNYCIKI